MAILEVKSVKVYQMDPRKSAQYGIRKFQDYEDTKDKLEQFGGPKEIIEALYEKVYSTNITVVQNKEISACDRLYMESNEGDHPVGWKGHSMSMSDIVQVGEKYFYCDGIGWEELD